MLAQEIGIDLGSANTVVVVKRRGVVASEPSVVAVNRQSQAIIAVGKAASKMIGRTPDTIISVRPIQGGVISDLNHSTALLKHMIRQIAGSRWVRPHVVLAIQSNASEVDKRALAEAAVQAGAGTVHLMEETVAAALGAGLPVEQAVGSLLVDIGSGSTNAAVISLGGVVVSASCNVAGDQMDEAIARYLKREHNLLVGAPTAERLKVEYGAALLEAATGTATLTGRLLTTGIPASVHVEAREIYHAISDLLAQIDHVVIGLLERTPPELLGDISRNGLTLTGGSALLRGLVERLADRTRLPVHLADSPQEAVAIGTGRVLENRHRVNLYRVKA
ncbi:MAG: cell shape determining protein MreB/Mrl family [Firmicutes bacterium]|nr:cell shape determining protein MreB/Mrl family [Bacillota bacterium]